MGEIIDRARLRVRLKWNRLTGRTTFTPNTDQIADARATLDALKRAHAINDYEEAGLRDAVNQTEVRDPNINVGDLRNIGSNRIDSLYNLLINSQNRDKLTADDLGELHYASQLAQAAEAQSRGRPTHDSNRRSLLATTGLLAATVAVGGVAALVSNSLKKEPERSTAPEVKIEIRDLTTEPTPKSPTGWSLGLVDDQDAYLAGIIGSGGRPMPFDVLVSNQQNISVPDARYYPAVSFSDVKLLIHQNPDGSWLPAFEIATAIDYKMTTVRWVVRDPDRIVKIQNVDDIVTVNQIGGEAKPRLPVPTPTPIILESKRTAFFQSLVLRNLTQEQKESLLSEKLSEAKHARITLDELLGKSNHVFLLRYHRKGK